MTAAAFANNFDKKSLGGPAEARPSSFFFKVKAIFQEPPGFAAEERRKMEFSTSSFV